MFRTTPRNSGGLLSLDKIEPGLEEEDGGRSWLFSPLVLTRIHSNQRLHTSQGSDLTEKIQHFFILMLSFLTEDLEI